MNDFFFQFHAKLMDPERIPYALAAILVTMVVGVITGPLAGNANPLQWLVVDKLFGGIGDKLDKTHRPRADLMFRGFMLGAGALLFALILGKFYQYLSIHYSYYTITQVLLLSTLLASGSLWFVLLRLYFAVEQKQVGQGAYYAVARTTRKNLVATDDFGIMRTAIGLSARSFDKGMVAPVFWYLVGGLPMAVVYSVIAALVWRFNKDGFSKGFGAVLSAMEKLLGFAPGLFSAALLTLASLFTPTARVHMGLSSWANMKNRATYEQGWLPLSVLAWSLGVSLGGASQDLSGSAIKAPWVGPANATAKINHKHLRRALFLDVTAHFLFLVALCSAYLWSGSL
jgi:adenosylcobinamide-phosphate synthase